MNKILLNDEIGYWGITSSDFISQLNLMDGDVTIEINSPGGDVFQGIEMYNALKAYDKGQITTIITSMAASMASYIALAGNKIIAYDNATYMIHNAWSVAWGDHRDMRKTADILEGLTSMLAKKYVSKTGKSKDEVTKLCDDETYFFGNEILENGFCDEIISTEEETEKIEALAFSKEKFKACVKNMNENFNKDEFVQSAAKLVKDGILANEVKASEPVVLDDNEVQEKAKREIEIYEREVF